MNNCQDFPETVEEFMDEYKMVNTEEVYSNGTEYVPIFRMKQWFEHERNTAYPEKGKWIPCSERLPKESGIYLVTMKTDGVAHFESEFPDGFVYVSTYEAVIMHWGYGGKNVIAWMPLPKPYRGEE